MGLGNAGSIRGRTPYRDPAAPVRAPGVSLALPDQTSEAAVVIPLVYGTCRVPGNILERSGPYYIPFNSVGSGVGFTNEKFVVPTTAPYQVTVRYAAAWTGDGAFTDLSANHSMSCPYDWTTSTRLLPGSGAWTAAAGVYTFAAAYAGHTIGIVYTYDFSRGQAGVAPAQGNQFDVAIGLCEGPISRIGQSWLDRLAYASLSSLGASSVLQAKVASSPAPTTTSFGTNLASPDGALNGSIITFTSGPNKGATRSVASYANLNGVITLASIIPGGPAALFSVPSVGDIFILTSPPRATNVSLALGVQPQSRPGWKTTVADNAPGSDTYSNTAVLYANLGTGASSNLPSMSFEIFGLALGIDGMDANPADIVIDLLTHPRRGAGWPTSRVDISGSLADNIGSYRRYCDQAGLNLSWLINSQTSALDLVSQLLRATNADAAWSGGVLKVIPRCDQTIGTFVPNSTPVYDLTPDDFLEPIRVERVASADTFNSWPVEYVARAREYQRLVVDDPAMDDVDRRGLRKAETTSFPFVLDPSAASMISRILTQRSVSSRNTYTVVVGWRYILLEPGDIVTLSDPVMGLSHLPVRIDSWEEDAVEGRITLTCIDWPPGIGHAAKFTPQAGDGCRPQTGDAVDQFVLRPGAIGDSQTTRGASVDNLWPNPTSEQAPPDGADLTSPEWSSLYNAGAGAYAGSWVRQVTAVNPTAANNQFPGQIGNQAAIWVTVPCAPSDTFYIEAQALLVAGAPTGSHCGAWVYFHDATGALVGQASSSFYVTAIGGSWAKAWAQGTAPAGSVIARLALWSEAGPAGNAAAQFDAIYARRVLDSNVIGAGTVQQGNLGGGSVTDDKLGGGQGVNLLYNSDFSAGVPSASNHQGPGWRWDGPTVSDCGLMLGAGWNLNNDPDPKNTNHNNAFYVHEVGQAGGAASLDFRSSTIAVDPSAKYAFSIFTAAHRCNLQVFIEWFQSSGSYSAIQPISWGAAPGTGANYAEMAGGTTLAGWKRIYVVDTPPSDAAYCKVVVRKSDTAAGQPDSYMFLCRGQFEQVGANATLPGPWVPSASNVIGSAGQTHVLKGGLSYTPVSLSVTKGSDFASAAVVSGGFAIQVNLRRATGTDSVTVVGGMTSASAGSYYRAILSYCPADGSYVNVQFIGASGNLVALQTFESWAVDLVFNFDA